MTKKTEQLIVSKDVMRAMCTIAKTLMEIAREEIFSESDVKRIIRLQGEAGCYYDFFNKFSKELGRINGNGQ